MGRISVNRVFKHGSSLGVAHSNATDAVILQHTVTRFRLDSNPSPVSQNRDLKSPQKSTQKVYLDRPYRLDGCQGKMIPDLGNTNPTYSILMLA